MFRYFKRVKILSQIIDEKNILLVEKEHVIIGLKEENRKLQKELNGRSYVALEENTDKLEQAKKIIGNLCYVYQLGKNELATARVVAEAEEFLKEVENDKRTENN